MRERFRRERALPAARASGWPPAHGAAEGSDRGYRHLLQAAEEGGLLRIPLADGLDARLRLGGAALARRQVAQVPEERRGLVVRLRALGLDEDVHPAPRLAFA